MIKTLIAVAFILTSGIVFAQPSLSIYGWLDAGYIRETNRDWRMEQNDSNALGIRGYEDLGGGLQARFDLQTRFNLQDGALTNPEKEWDGTASIGLAHPRWGSLYFGHLNEVNTETFRIIDPFNQDGVSSTFRSTQRSPRIDNTLRYDSPKWRGLEVHGSYSVSEDKRHAGPASATAFDADNHGYAFSARYDRGPFILLGSWSRRVDSNNSSSWNLGTAYSFGKIRLSFGYEKTIDNGWQDGYVTSSDIAGYFGGSRGVKSQQETWITGLKWRIGPGMLNSFFSYAKVKSIHISGTPIRFDNAHARKIGLGYNYDLSKRTYLYIMGSYTDYSSQIMSMIYRNSIHGGEKVTTFQIGMFHQF